MTETIAVTAALILALAAGWWLWGRPLAVARAETEDWRGKEVLARLAAVEAAAATKAAHDQLATLADVEHERNRIGLELAALTAADRARAESHAAELIRLQRAI